MPAASEPVVALEIGTSKVIALVAELREDGHAMVIGLGQQPSAGVRKGQVIDLQNATESVRTALLQAEENADVEIAKIVLSISGGHIQSVVNRGYVTVVDPHYEITAETIEEVAEIAAAAPLTLDCEKIHTIRQNFSLDGKDAVSNPLGMEARVLHLSSLVIYGAQTPINNTIKVIQSLKLEVEDVAFSGLCSALAVLTPEQKQSGAVVLDIGAGTIDFLVYADNVVASAGSIGVGGEHLTNDVALGLNLPRPQAEWLKLEHGSALECDDDSDSKVSIPADGGFSGRQVSLRALRTILHARADEMLRIVHDRLAELDLLHHMAGGVVITGGCARLPGLTDLALSVFNCPCQIGYPRNISGLMAVSEGPEFATASGLIRYAYQGRGVRQKPRNGGLFNWILGRSS
ncbi:MAG: cell division protein FtsA [Lentisphaerae bacterium RIFOXYC12_FULL_60_16]|nr:MAG: cell division protein FtsA [Lentisphaerae bacterium RIFOXYC12_FULL_60_16]OGV75011.1 MAG: cell division protein FtsA [Lentisphaerae bacterium RIFOXYA12_FULL_60_10]OGV85249.1 MAG: cell division protein FtsA [Lentisphaerae bacterium RIFOXYB12_FULL_60_10]